jgi:hypothetical protein
MKGFKAFNKNMTCRGFQFEEGKVYEESKADCCNSGFHFCENPLDTLNYYNLCESEFAEVEALGEISKHGDDTKAATTKIKIGLKLGLPGFIKASFDYLWEQCKINGNIDDIQAASGNDSKLAASGNYSKLAASGYYSKLAASGNYSKLAASGYNSQLAASGNDSKLAASGYNSQLAASGYYSKLAASGNDSKLAASGYYSQLELNGQNSVGAAIGIDSIIKGKKGCWITLAEYEHDGESYKPVCVKSAQIDGETIKEDTWYKLENSEFVEVGL